jgi:hypothetical protein
MTEPSEFEYVAVSREAYGRGFTDAQALAAWAGSITEDTADALVDGAEVTIYRAKGLSRVTPDGIVATEIDVGETITVDQTRLDNLRGSMLKVDALARMALG